MEVGKSSQRRELERKIKLALTNDIADFMRREPHDKIFLHRLDEDQFVEMVMATMERHGATFPVPG